MVFSQWWRLPLILGRGLVWAMADDYEDDEVQDFGSRKKRGVIFTLVTLLLSIGVALPLAEFASRLIYTPQVPTIPHPVYHHTRLANSTARWTSSQGEFDTTVSFNSFALRGSEPDLGKEHLWLIMGDSLIEALQVPEEETACRYLADQLGDGYTVMNAGVGGYSPVLSWLRLRALLEDLSPKVPEKVVLCMFPNDLEEEYIYRFTAYKDKKGEVLMVTPGLLRGPVGQLKAWAFRHSEIVQLLQKSFGNIGNERQTKVDPYYLSDNVLYPYRVVWTQKEKEVWAEMFRSIGDIKRLCDSTGIDLAIAIIPAGHQIDGETWKTGKKEMYSNIETDYVEDSTSFQDEIIKRSRRIDIPTIDLLPEFKEHPQPKDLYFDFDGHWTAEGNRFAATVIERRLMEMEAKDENP
ncbi:MAG: SGNH/GDSL hydrolase family protein [Candidatus Omnitrophica bacterium]|nr:SGNH/GDSL hydrolase family protein [Candidatus Omnitrophota bacterium]